MWYGKYEVDEPKKKKKPVDEQSGPFYGKGFNNGLEDDEKIETDETSGPFYGKGFNNGEEEDEVCQD